MQVFTQALQRKKNESFCFMAWFGQELVDKGSKHDDYWCLAQAQEHNVALNTTDNVQCFQPCIVCTTVITAIFAAYNSAHSPNSIKQLCSASGGSGQQVWSYKTAGDRCLTSQQLPAFSTPRKQLLHQNSEVAPVILPAKASPHFYAVP